MKFAGHFPATYAAARATKTSLSQFYGPQKKMRAESK